ncbi:substrate-binding domain-containing protein [Erwinia phyllosphaerae]|uniref:substrate-binding domain-containing protein n=1 Tax=Erwinia phyllosphaerae TaxID=2853256 RepID=UPI001FEFBE8C|nr:substrate-binding domain-containing protein [Erwinia phyllosphaerae]MBV4365696.1 substrate-binding domain-containing protein [Erwinia phyllosphaerae]
MGKTSRCLSLAALFFLSAGAQAQELTIMISGGFNAAWQKLAPRFAAQEGYKVVTVTGPSMGNSAQAIPTRLAHGEKADVVIMVGDALTKLDKAGWILKDSRVELADSTVGAVVRKGDAPVDISTEEALRNALLKARSIAYSDSASGRYVSGQLFEKLGIKNEVQNKAHQIERVPVASMVADGKYQLGFQQVSELRPVSGVTFIGELPASLQYTTRFAGAVTKTSAHRQEAQKLLQYLSSAAVQPTVQATGLKTVKASQAAKQADTVQ